MIFVGFGVVAAIQSFQKRRNKAHNRQMQQIPRSDSHLYFISQKRVFHCFLYATQTSVLNYLKVRKRRMSTTSAVCLKKARADF
ncbi:CLUMA_CG011639, isoform A [Clunio marinus]|uniref:CLUMA_CG011639, isoform A n=1 Tax=Clunio marinus TaxID=568069 RepID=A0A1J1IDD0_9DIPT|nr:CLUMA_CG011639, isoform A [Clunio marinus]